MSVFRLIVAATALLASGHAGADLFFEVSEQTEGTLTSGSFSGFQIIELSSDYPLADDGYTQLGLTLTDTTDNSSTTLHLPFIVDALARANETNTPEFSLLLDGDAVSVTEQTEFAQFNLASEMLLADVGSLATGIKEVTITATDTANTSNLVRLPFIAEFIDSDGDGLSNFLDPDDDNDGVPDLEDAFPLSPVGSVDTDQDGIANSIDTDDDNDGIPDAMDDDPLNVDGLNLGEPTSFDSPILIGSADVSFMRGGSPVSTANLGIGEDGMSGVRKLDSASGEVSFDLDQEYDAVRISLSDLRVATSSVQIGFDAAHFARLKPLPDAVSISSTVGLDMVDVATTDSSLAGMMKLYDVGLWVSDATFTTPYFRVDAGITTDDGVSTVSTLADRSIDDDNIPAFLDPDLDNDGVLNGMDAFPEDPLKFEIEDFDGDGIPDDQDTDDDNDGVLDINDAFPFDDSESGDADNDGIGDNADPDDDNDGTVDTEDACPLDPTCQAAAQPGRLINIATRGFTRLGDEVIIGGLFIAGSEPKDVVIRAIGPTLGVADPNLADEALEDPMLELYSGSTLIDSNDDWLNHPNQSQIPDHLQPAFSREAAIFANLPAGPYTAIVRGMSADQGIALVEIFEVDTQSETTRLINIATRGLVGIGADVLIGGLIIGGEEPLKVTIRARGPSLISADPNLAGQLLLDPELSLFAGSTQIDYSDDWQEHSTVGELRADLAVGLDVKEAVITRTLAPGAYTAIVRGVEETTGIGIVEVFSID